MSIRLAVVSMLIATACSGSPAAQTDDPSVTTTAGIIATTVVDPSSTTAAPSAESTTTSTTPAPPPSCGATTGIPFDSSLVASPIRLIDGPVTVDAVIYPHPEYEGNPWSQWGQGVVTSDGRFFSAIGDHIGVDGNSYLYEYDPATQQLSLIADISEVVGHVPASWGYGKVHAQMVEGQCGIYVASYWGTRRGLEFDENYLGDHLLHVDPVARTVSDVTVILPEHGVPSLASSPAYGLIYAEAVDPFVQPNEGWFVVLDEAGNEVFRTDTGHVGFRSMAVDADGRALFSAGSGQLAVYDPEANEVTVMIDGLPGEWLRAATAPAPDGTIYGVTREPDELFALSADGSVRALGPVEGYTTSLAMTADGSTLYYVPYAHGGSWRHGTPVLAVDTATGTQTVLATLNAAAEEKLGLTLGGTYNIALSPDDSTLYIGMNADEVGARDTFGVVVLLIVQLNS